MAGMHCLNYGNLYRISSVSYCIFALYNCIYLYSVIKGLQRCLLIILNANPPALEPSKCNILPRLRFANEISTVRELTEILRFLFAPSAVVVHWFDVQEALDGLEREVQETRINLPNIRVRRPLRIAKVHKEHLHKYQTMRALTQSKYL